MKRAEVSNRLEAFVQDHPTGWDHQSWLRLLATLESEGVDVSDPDEIGRSLEQTRLAHTLKSSSVKGLGPKRIEAVVDRFGTLWNLRHASIDDIAEIPAVPTALAERLHQAIN